MSELSTAVSSGSGGEIVRGEGNAPGQSAGEAMPAVTTNERKSLSDFKRDMEAKNNAPRAPAQPQTAKSRIGAFSEALEKRQQAPVMPNDARGQQEAERDEREPPVVQQLSESEPSALAVDDSSPSELVEGTPEGAISVDDRQALEKYRQWEQDDMFPAELEAKLHEVKVNGQVRYVPTTELRQGYMRGGDYRRAYNEVQQQQQVIARERQATQEHFQAIRDPNNFLEIYERNGYGQALDKVADLILERRNQRKQIIEGAGIAAMRSLGLRQVDWNHKDVVAAMQRAENDLVTAHNAAIERRKLEFERSRFQQQQQQTISQQKQAEYGALYDRQINQLRPNAFRAYGLADTAANRAALIRHLNNVVNTIPLGNDGITRQHIMAAASDLKDETDDARAREQGLDAQQRKPAGGAPLPPRRIAAGGGNPMGNLGGRKQGRLSDLEAEIRARRTQ